ncbi:MAG: TatD family deoxyribonuclease [Planctomycetota bacterium]|nr:MAG: TatD family deoxyribonuclease [Planctomycetota bacterium]
MGLIDSHAHLTFPELRDQIEDVLGRCERAGVERVITVGVNLEDARAALELALRYPGRVSAAAGFHPHEAEGVSDGEFAAMFALWDNDEVVALGEMGLDYHYDFADRRAQREVFARQLRAASHRDKPIIIHCREAFTDLVPMLLDHGFARRRVVFHCFTGSASEALVIQEHGWRLSFTGIVTFPKSQVLQDIARIYPRHALMLETDAPYLSPVPVRGRRPNEPAHLAHTARFLAELRGQPVEELIEQTRKNTRQFFGLPDGPPPEGAR